MWKQFYLVGFFSPSPGFAAENWFLLSWGAVLQTLMHCCSRFISHWSESYAGVCRIVCLNVCHSWWWMHPAVGKEQILALLGYSHLLFLVGKWRDIHCFREAKFFLDLDWCGESLLRISFQQWISFSFEIAILLPKDGLSLTLTAFTRALLMSGLHILEVYNIE